MNKGIIILSHGSRNLEVQKNFLQMVNRIAKRLPTLPIKPAFFSLATPNLEQAIKDLKSQKIQKIIIYPYFLNTGVHIKHDLPNLISQFKQKFPNISFEITSILGEEPLLEELIFEKISLQLWSYNTKKLPQEIENQSFEFITQFLTNTPFSDEERSVLTRVIHATCDFSYISTLKFHPKAIKIGNKLIKEKAPIFCDVQMVKAGLTTLENVFCLINDPKIKQKALDNGITRAVASFREWGDKLNDSLIVIGNAPTALEEVLRLFYEHRIKPALIIGVPVGFVGAAASKEMLLKSKIPYITNLGPKGGSSVAAAIVNGIKNLKTKKN